MFAVSVSKSFDNWSDVIKSQCQPVFRAGPLRVPFNIASALYLTLYYDDITHFFKFVINI